MYMKKENITQSLKVILLAIVLSFGISYVFAWAPPTVAPTGGNSTAPLNTSNSDQVKNGNLFLNALGITNTAPNALSVLGGGYFGGDIEVANGSGITLGGVKKTVWPSDGGAADWNTMLNKPAGFADNVDNAGVQECTTVTNSIVAAWRPVTVVASCSPGWYMTGGACNAITTGDNIPSGNGWSCTVTSGAGSILVRSYSRCCR